MTQTNINIRIDEDLKKRFDFLCNEFGLTMSTAINMFVKAVVRENRIPLDLSLHIPNTTTIQAIQDIENGLKKSIPYTNSSDVLQTMLSDEDEYED